MDKMQEKCFDIFFSKAIITSKRGHIFCSNNVREVMDTKFDCAPGSTYYHLIKNNQMMSEFKDGLLEASVADKNITLEMYFNHKVNMDANLVDRITATFTKTFPGVVV